MSIALLQVLSMDHLHANKVFCQGCTSFSGNAVIRSLSPYKTVEFAPACAERAYRGPLTTNILC